MSVEIRRGTARFVERGPGRLTRHSFSFGEAYDADNLRFGPMLCHDDHLLGDGHGFEAHRHRDLVILTWVLTGSLSHTDAAGSTAVGPGSVAVLRTGEGVEHAEVAAAPQTRFVQVWLSAPEDAEPDPSYSVTPVDVGSGSLVPVAEPVAGARFRVAHLDANQTLTLPEAPLVHVYVARGALLRSSLAEPLHDGDAFRFADEPSYDVTAAVPSQVLVWTFGSA